MSSTGCAREKHQRRLHLVARGILRNDADAEEAVQSAHLHVLTHRDQFLGRSSFVSWLTRIVINESLGRVRTRARAPVLELAGDLGQSPEAVFISGDRSPEVETFEHELRGALRQALRNLPEKYRAAFALKEIETLSIAETAQRLGITDDCAKTRIHRARLLQRKRLRKVMRGCGSRRGSAGNTARRVEAQPGHRAGSLSH